MTPPASPRPPAASAPSSAAYPSVDIVYDEVKDVTDGILNERDALNTRASFILGAASILIGAATAVLSAVSPLKPSPASGLVRRGIAVDVVLYIVVVVFAALAYVEKSTESPTFASFNPFRTINPYRLSDYLKLPEEDTKRALIRVRLDNYLANSARLRVKRRLIVIALLALLAEVVWLGVLLIVVAIAQR